MTTTHDLLRAADDAEILTDAIDLAEEADRPALEARLTDLLASLAQAAPDKLDALRYVALRMGALAEQHHEEERRQAAMRRARERVFTRCRESAEQLVRAVGRTTTLTATYRLQAGPVAVTGPADIGPWAEQGWIRVREEPDRTLARASLDSMPPEEWPPGFALDRRDSLRW